MRPAIIKISKKVSLSNKNQNPLFKTFIDTLAHEVDATLHIHRVDSIENFRGDFRKQLDEEANLIASSSLQHMDKRLKKEFFPENQIEAKDAKVDITKAVLSEGEFEFDLHLISEPITLLDNLGNKLLVKAGDYSGALKDFEIPYPFLIELSKDMTLVSYQGI